MANRPPELSNLRTTLAAAAVTVTVVAWGLLVFAAINFGRTARAGANNGWLYLVLTTLGAVACMFAAIVMAAHLQSLMGAQRSSTRPLAQPLNELPPLDGVDDAEPWTAQTSGQVAPQTLAQAAPAYGPSVTTYPGGSVDPARSQPGKRAAR